VACFVGRKTSKRRACELLGISRRRLAYEAAAYDRQLLEKLMELARRYPRYGVRHLTAKLRQAGWRVNRKRVARLCRKHGLLLKQKRRRKRLGIGVGMPCRAESMNHVWSYDFMEDRTETGRKLRILTVVDEFTRRCLAIEVEHRMGARFVAETLLRLFAEHGAPAFLRSDNGPEFIAKYLMRFLAAHGVSARHIDPGSPWQNGIDERFNGTLRDECLNLETFHNRDHAGMLIRLFMREYNECRPHSTLGYQTPSEFAATASKRPGVPVPVGVCPTPRDLSTYARNGLEEADPASPDRPSVPRSTTVLGLLSQQSPVLRVDETSVESRTKPGSPRRKTSKAPLND
jgi:putative transposase